MDNLLIFSLLGAELKGSFTRVGAVRGASAR
jgi:hypothetical protein